MKITCSLACCLLMLLNAFAQQYVPMTSPGNKWLHVISGANQISSSRGYHQLMVTNDDTTIGAHTYKKIMIRTWDTLIHGPEAYKHEYPVPYNMVANKPDGYYGVNVIPR